MFTLPTEAVAAAVTEMAASQVAQIAAGTFLGISAFYVTKVAGSAAYDTAAPYVSGAWNYICNAMPTFTAKPDQANA